MLKLTGRDLFHVGKIQTYLMSLVDWRWNAKERHNNNCYSVVHVVFTKPNDDSKYLKNIKWIQNFQKYKCSYSLNPDVYFISSIYNPPKTENDRTITALIMNMTNIFMTMLYLRKPNTFYGLQKFTNSMDGAVLIDWFVRYKNKHSITGPLIQQTLVVKGY